MAEEHNFWLKYLTNDLKTFTATQKIIDEYGKYAYENLYHSVMNVIIDANQKKFKEGNVCVRQWNKLLLNRKTLRMRFALFMKM